MRRLAVRTSRCWRRRGRAPGAAGDPLCPAAVAARRARPRRSASRRRLPRAARPVRRGRHGAGPARDWPACLRRRRRARLALAMDKDVMQGRAARRRHCRSARWCSRHGADEPRERDRRARRRDARLAGVRQAGATSGSSVGISKVHGADELPAALDAGVPRTTRRLLVEELVAGREVECGVLGNERPEASAVGEILPARRVVRLRREVRRGRLGHRRAGRPAAPTSPSGARASPCAPFQRLELRRAWRASTSSSSPAARCC